MQCLHGKEAKSSSTKNGNFWFCAQNPKCQFICSEGDSYLYEKAIQAFLSTNQALPRCCVFENFAKFNVVKDPSKESYGRPFFVCSKKNDRCEYFEWGDETIIEKPFCKHGKRCKVWKVKKEGPNQGRSFLICPHRHGEKCDFFKWFDSTPVPNPMKNTFVEKNDCIDPFTAYVPKFYTDYSCTTPKRVKKDVNKTHC